MYVGVEDKTVDDKNYSNFVQDQRKKIREGFDRARESLGVNADRSKKRYDMRVRLYFCPRHRVGRSPKWQNFYSGPYFIEKY